MQEDVTRLMSAPVSFNTDSLELLCTGLHNHMNDSFAPILKLVVYHDSTVCTSCVFQKLHKWDDFIEKAKAHKGNLELYFIFSPPSNEQHLLKVMVKNYKPKMPIYMDTAGVFRRTTPQLPSNPMLHTFLLDENNEVLVVGNPLENEKIDRMFWRTVKEKLGTGQKEKAND